MLKEDHKKFKERIEKLTEVNKRIKEVENNQAVEINKLKKVNEELKTIKQEQHMNDSENYFKEEAKSKKKTKI